jgi:hypothetical protein
MVKLLLNFLLIFFFLTSFSLAKNDDIKVLARLQSEYGQNLAKVPYFLRFSFEKAFNIKWENSYFYERRAFLTYYDSGVAADMAKEKAEAKAAAEKAKERSLEEREALKRDKERAKEDAVEQKAEQKEYDQRQKDFASLLKAQQKDLQQMQKGVQGN